MFDVFCFLSDNWYINIRVDYRLIGEIATQDIQYLHFNSNIIIVFNNSIIILPFSICRMTQENDRDEVNAAGVTTDGNKRNTNVVGC